MECAITLGKRGMQSVHLVEAADELGGHFRWVRQLPGLAEWGRVVDWRQSQLAKLANVHVVSGKRLDAPTVLDYGADLVVIATGSSWATDGLNGPSQSTITGADAALPHILTPEQIMLEGKPVPGDRVVVYDCEAYFVGVSIAEKLARAGKQVTLVTPMAGPALYMGLTGEAVEMMPLLAELKIAVVARHHVTEIGDGLVHGVPKGGGPPRQVGNRRGRTDHPTSSRQRAVSRSQGGSAWARRLLKSSGVGPPVDLGPLGRCPCAGSV
ncbi:NAD(P)/FAD-dependent oxidoreductase [Pseudonocardia kujensis]|nr:NAD(P)/FAD-dependent oxidoreductase [Pseudonocardia kujensis]